MREMHSTREAYGAILPQLGSHYPKIVVIDCDVGKSCKTGAFAAKFPERHINAGIAEQGATALAAGLAVAGFIPLLTTYAVIGSMRMLEQIRQSICYNRLNVKLICSHGGLTPANDGASHQCIEDMGIFRTIPGITVMTCADAYSAAKLIELAVTCPGPVYMRLTRDPVPDIYKEGDSFTVGRAVEHSEGRDVQIFSLGEMLSFSLKAAERLNKMGVSAGVTDVHTLKPLDREAVLRAARRTGRLITVEDHSVINGLGSAVSEILAETGCGRLARVGVPDRFSMSGRFDELLAYNHMAVNDIVAAAVHLSEVTHA